MEKLKILFCSEASYMATGYSIMYQNIIRDCYSSGKYEIAEHASYAKITDERSHSVSWKLYCNAPNNQQDPRNKEYNSEEGNKFGKWRFNRVMLDFKPDVVFSCRDIYMDSHILRSPLAKYCHTIIAPPIDSRPQREEFLELYTLTDTIFAQTEYAAKVLKEDVAAANYQGNMSAGVDLQTFYPRNKEVVRGKYNISKDSLIFGMIGRNQPRKLYPNLIEGFSKYLKIVSKELAQKSFLYLHTSYPEKEGWNIPKIIKEFDVAQKIIFSYQCSICDHIYASIYSDARMSCPACGQLAGKNPTVAGGFTREQVAEIYNIFDLYIHVANAEGLGLPVIEAAACGIPVASMDYDVMGEVVSNLGGFKIKTACEMRDMRNDSYRCCPDNNSIALVMKEFAEGKMYDLNKQFDAIKEIYDFKKVAAFIMDYVDKLDLPSRWAAPYTPYNPPISFPANLSNSAFVDFLYFDVLRNPSFRNSYSATSIERDLHYGISIQEGEIKPVSRQALFDYFRSIAVRNNNLEMQRLGLAPLPNEDYLAYANRSK